MTDTAETTVAVDPVPVTLYTYGLSGEPLRMAPADWQPIIAAIRRANVGDDLDAADIQPLLDATFPGAGYQADDLVLPHPPAPNINNAGGNQNTGIYTDTPNNDLDLPAANITWDFGDGTIVQGGHTVTHTWKTVGVYTIRLEIVVAGRVYSDTFDQPIGNVAKPVAPVLTALIPDSVGYGGADVLLTIIGSGFTPESMIVWNGGDEVTVVVSSTAITTRVETSTATGPLAVPVAVRNGDLVSNELTFMFVEAAPSETDEEEPEEFDPASHTVDEVVAYAEENPDELDRLIGEEETGKTRVTLLDKLHAMSANATT
jgi:hypothetical protein